jgi:hypothetical protein
MGGVVPPLPQHALIGVQRDNFAFLLTLNLCCLNLFPFPIHFTANITRNGSQRKGLYPQEIKEKKSVSKDSSLIVCDAVSLVRQSI